MARSFECLEGVRGVGRIAVEEMLGVVDHFLAVVLEILHGLGNQLEVFFEQLVLVAQRRLCLGSEEPETGTLAALQHASARWAVDARVPIVQLDRTGCLGIRRGGRNSRRTALLCPAAPGRLAQRSLDHGR